MFGSKVLEVGIGLSLLFLFVSLICTAIREMIEAFMKSRAMDVERGIRLLLNEPKGETYTKQFFSHPFIYALSKGDYDPDRLTTSLFRKYASDRLAPVQAAPVQAAPVQAAPVQAAPAASFHARMPVWARSGMPSYIPAAQFAGALIDILAHGPVDAAPNPSAATMPVSMQSLRDSVSKITNPKLQRALLAAIDAAQGDLDNVKANLEQWYNGTMDRVAGWYKRRTQVILFFLGLGAAVFLNVDAITVATHLAREQSLQTSVLDHAEKLIPVGTKGDTVVGDELKELSKQSLAELTKGLGEIDYPVGWEGRWPKQQAPALKCAPGDCSIFGVGYPVKFLPALSLLLGWLITALAVTLGAPFWFDVLNKFMVIRSTVKPDEKSRDEGSKDAQGAQNPPSPAATGGSASADAPPPTPNPLVPSLAAFQTTLTFQPHQWATGNPFACDM